MEKTSLNLADAENSINITSNKSGSKRDATSPLYSDIRSLKKTRADMHGKSKIVTGEGANSQDRAGLRSNVDADVHVLSWPMNPTEIIQVAKELTSIMVLELKLMIEVLKHYIKEMKRT